MENEEEVRHSNSNMCGMCSIPNECACTCKYNFQLNEKEEPVQMPSREELLEKIKCYRFAIIEISLYLDTHPEDKKALCLHNEYAKKFKQLEDMYQRLYGPLSIMHPCKKWRWIDSPWPWEGECK